MLMTYDHTRALTHSPRSFDLGPGIRRDERMFEPTLWLGLTYHALAGRGDGVGDVEEHARGVAGEGLHRGDDHNEDQAADQAILDGGGAAPIGQERAHKRSRSQATSGASAGGIGYAPIWLGLTHAIASCSSARTEPSQRRQRYSGIIK